jgi:outer membrane biosynthesis protein TonB
MTSSKNNGFTAYDIEQYHSGKMTAQERHAIEKAALDDPFLADALEGYTFSHSPINDVAKIQSRLDEKLNRKKLVPLFQKYRWLSAAAIVLIIAGAGWLVYSISESGKSADLAIQQEKDSSANSNSSASSNYAMPRQTLETDSLQAPLNNQANVSNKAKTVLETYDSKDNELAHTRQKQTNSEKEITPNKKETVSEIAAPVAIQTQPVNNNTFASAERKKATVDKTTTADAKANVRLEQAQSQAPPVTDMASAKTATAGRVNGIKTNDSIKNMDVVLHPLPTDSLALQEVVVGYGKQHRQAEKYPRVIIDTLEPAEGYVKFDDYIASNLKTPEELKIKPIPGEVQLSFDVDKNGQPVNITVLKSLCQTCDEEAIRLLKDGPKWKKKKSKRGKVTIRF